MSSTSAYLARLGIDVPPPPTLDTLVLLHRRHLERVPYENVSIMLGRPPSVDPEASLARIGAIGRAGYCFHQNGALELVLRDLGYDVTRRHGHVWSDETSREADTLNHLALVVAGLPAADNPGGQWWVDVGLGDGFRSRCPWLRASTCRAASATGSRRCAPTAGPSATTRPAASPVSRSRHDRPTRPRCWGRTPSSARRASAGSPGSWSCSAATRAAPTTLRGCVLHQVTGDGATQAVLDSWQSWRSGLVDLELSGRRHRRGRPPVALRAARCGPTSSGWLTGRPRVARGRPDAAGDRRRALRAAPARTSPPRATRWSRSTRAPTLAAAGQGAAEAVPRGVGGQPARAPRPRPGRPGARGGCGAARRPGDISTRPAAGVHQAAPPADRRGHHRRRAGWRGEEGVKVTQAVADQVEATLTAAMLESDCGAGGAQRAAGHRARRHRARRPRPERRGGAAGRARLQRDAPRGGARPDPAPSCTSYPTRMRTRRRAPRPSERLAEAEDVLAEAKEEHDEAGRRRREAPRPGPCSSRPRSTSCAARIAALEADSRRSTTSSGRPRRCRPRPRRPSRRPRGAGRGRGRRLEARAVVPDVSRSVLHAGPGNVRDYRDRATRPSPSTARRRRVQRA